MQFLSTIPLAILNNIGFMSLLYLIYQGIKLFISKPTVLFGVSIFFQVLGFFHFLLILFLPDVTIHQMVSQKLTFISWSQFSLTTILPYVGLAYFFILVFFITKTCFRAVALTQLKSSVNYSDSSKLASLINTSSFDFKQLNKFKNIKIGLTEKINTPLTFGYLNPVILMPMSICNHLSTKEIETILLHELAHILRNDYLLHIVTSVMHLVLYFNPMSYYFNREISLQREIACDSWVVNSKINKIDYLNALYKLALEIKTPQFNALGVGFFKNKSELLVRFNYLNNTAHRFNFNLKTILALGFGLLIMVVSIKEKPNLYKLNNFATIQNILVKNKIIPKKDKLKNYPNKIINTTVENNNSTQMDTIPTYSDLVKKTSNWIKNHESENKFATYKDASASIELEIAEKLVIRKILFNYQLKMDLLNEKLLNASSDIEATAYAIHSKEWTDIIQFEKWKKQFLALHPIVEDEKDHDF